MENSNVGKSADKASAEINALAEKARASLDKYDALAPSQQMPHAEPYQGNPVENPESKHRVQINGYTPTKRGIEFSSENFKKWLAVAASLLAFSVVKACMQTNSAHEPVANSVKSSNQSQASVEKLTSQLRADAIRKHPDVSASVAVQQEASERATKKITSETDGLKRAETAANMFYGFFFINVRERPEFCRAQGVDIQPFVKAFESSHIRELAKARSIYARSSTDENEFYTLLKPQMRKMIILDMNDIAASNKVSLREACQLIATNADTLAKEMHLSSANPAVFQALSSAK